MAINEIRKKIRSDLEAPAELRRFGSGWFSGVIALIAAIAGLFFVFCLRFPGVFTMPQVRAFYDKPVFRFGLHILLISAFSFSILSLILRKNKILGYAALIVTLVATLLGGSRVPPSGELTSGSMLGLDWFVLNIIFTGLLFIPIEKLFAKYPDQPVFRDDWREDLFYFFVSSLLVQVLTFLSLSPTTALVKHTHWTTLRSWVANQYLIVQFFEIMFLTDLVQYWVHRLFHRIPFLWKFHAVHHSAQQMDWIAGARMHFIEIVILRGTTIIPMYLLGFANPALYAYVLLVYVHSTFVHANVGWNFDRVGKFMVTPRYHHWHHGIEKEAIDVNFSIHFPLIDRVFGTYYLPPGQWPKGYGIDGHPVPKSYVGQFMYPFTKGK